jgi:hypothetical protein
MRSPAFCILPTAPVACRLALSALQGGQRLCVLSKKGRDGTMTRLSFATEFLVDSDLMAARST